MNCVYNLFLILILFFQISDITRKVLILKIIYMNIKVYNRNYSNNINNFLLNKYIWRTINPILMYILLIIYTEKSLFISIMFILISDMMEIS